jgi:hypothetical protein
LTAVGILATAAVATPVQAAPPPTTSLDPVGPAQTVFDWSTQACAPDDFPDLPARAFRDDRGRIQLVISHYVNRQLIGPDLDHLTVDCNVILSSSDDADPADYNDREWIAAVWTTDGQHIDALVHDEYQGNQHPGTCPQGRYVPCWYNAITFARSNDGGETYTQRRPPAQLVASVPYPYLAGAGPYGYFEPSNIVRDPVDGYLYAMMRGGGFGLQQPGTCLMRTQTPNDPSSWRGWSGQGFTVAFADPYLDPSLDPSTHVCAPVAYASISQMHDSLTYNTYLDRFLLVGAAALLDPSSGTLVPGIYWSQSRDLIHWTGASVIMAREVPWTYQCGDEDPIAYASLIDPRSRSRTFGTTGRRPYLYYTQFHYTACKQTLDRDLVRVPLKLSG